MDFVAIDFETATSSPGSICSMGLCVVENNKITDTKEILIKPEPFEFQEYNIRIHGITPDLVWGMPTFDQYWPKIRPYLENQTVVAHNASFDVGALRAVLEHFGIDYPTFRYICTVKLSQKAYPNLPSHKLNRLAEALDIQFSHHHAADDAYACAQVLLRILEDFGLDSLGDIEEHFQIGIGELYPGWHLPCTKNKKKRKSVSAHTKKDAKL